VLFRSRDLMETASSASGAPAARPVNTTSARSQHIPSSSSATSAVPEQEVASGYAQVPAPAPINVPAHHYAPDTIDDSCLPDAKSASVDIDFRNPVQFNFADDPCVDGSTSADAFDPFDERVFRSAALEPTLMEQYFAPSDLFVDNAYRAAVDIPDSVGLAFVEPSGSLPLDFSTSHHMPSLQSQPAIPFLPGELFAASYQSPTTHTTNLPLTRVVAVVQGTLDTFEMPYSYNQTKHKFKVCAYFVSGYAKLTVRVWRKMKSGLAVEVIRDRGERLLVTRFFDALAKALTDNVVPTEFSPEMFD